jgi:hypothetical protein
MTPAARRRVWWCAFLALYTLEQALLLWLYWGHGAKTLAGDEVIYSGWARHAPELAAFADSYLWPPLQAWFLRVLDVNVALVQLVQTAMLVACAGFLRALWLACDGRRRAANLAAALFLLNPSTAAYAHWLWPEVVHLFLMLAALWLLSLKPSPPGSPGGEGWVRGLRLVLPRDRGSAQRHPLTPSLSPNAVGGEGVAALRSIAGFIAGIATGLALLAKSLLTPFWPLFALLLVRGERPRFDWRVAALFAVGVLATIAVPLARGWQATGKPMVADSSAFNIVGGLSDRWRSDYVADSVGPMLGEWFAAGATPAERNAAFLERARHIVDERGVVETVESQLGRQYFRLFNAKTLLVSQLPGPACVGHMSVYHDPAPALAATLVAWNDLAHALMLVTFAFGLALWRRWREPLPWLALAFFAYQIALYLPLHVKARFLLPMTPFLCAFGASFLASLARPRDDAAVVLRGHWRWFAGGVLALLLFLLAFAAPWLDRSCG